jgi:hypothetical protein
MLTQLLGPETDKFCQFLGPEIVKMGQHSFWAKTLTLWVSFGAQKLTLLKRDILCLTDSCLAEEREHYREAKWTWTIITTTKIIKWYMYKFVFWKKQLGPETVKMYQFLGPETDPYCQFSEPKIMLTHFNDFWAQKRINCVNFWAQKSLKWAIIVSGPTNWRWARDTVCLTDSCLEEDSGHYREVSK